MHKFDTAAALWYVCASFTRWAGHVRVLYNRYTGVKNLTLLGQIFPLADIHAYHKLDPAMTKDQRAIEDAMTDNFASLNAKYKIGKSSISVGLTSGKKSVFFPPEDKDGKSADSVFKPNLGISIEIA